MDASRRRRLQQLPQKLCRHEGPLVDVEVDVSRILSTIESGEQLFVYGSCGLCGELIEREYAILRTLPQMAARLFPSEHITTEISLPLPVPLTGAPSALFMVHADVVQLGTCGLAGMNFMGVNAITKAFRYRCACGFEWELCASDLEQAVAIQGLHKSAAARRFQNHHR